MKQQARRRRLEVFILLGAGALLAGTLVFASLRLLTPQGWSKDVVFDDGQMKMLVQYKGELDPTTLGKANLMVKVKDAGGYLMLVDHVHFTVTDGVDKVVDGLEGERTGTFEIGSDSFYLATLEPTPGKPYQVEVEVAHRQSSFNFAFPFEVKAKQ